MRRSHSDKISGQALVEFTCILLLLVPLLMALYDFSCAIRANNSISNMSREGANLASRPSAGMQDDKQGIMNALALTAQPLDMRTNGMIFITEVQGNVILSQEGWKNSTRKDAVASRIGSPTASAPHPGAENLGPLKLEPGQTAYVVEVFYKYRSLFSNSGFDLSGDLYSRTVF